MSVTTRKIISRQPPADPPADEKPLRALWAENIALEVEYHFKQGQRVELTWSTWDDGKRWRWPIKGYDDIDYLEETFAPEFNFGCQTLSRRVNGGEAKPFHFNDWT